MCIVCSREESKPYRFEQKIRYLEKYNQTVEGNQDGNHPFYFLWKKKKTPTGLEKLEG